MAVLTKIKSSNIADDAITTDKIADSTGSSDGVTTAKIATGGITAAKVAADVATQAELDASGILGVTSTGASATHMVTVAGNLTVGGSYIKTPSVTTEQRDVLTPSNSMLVYNSTLGMLQQYSSGSWQAIATPPTITSFEYSDGASATAEAPTPVVLTCGTNTTSPGTTVTAVSTTGITVGVKVSGAGIPLGATVVSISTNVSFVLSTAVTATASVSLTFGGIITITGTGFDSVLGGSASNIAVTLGGTTATSISVNSARTIITATVPAKTAGTVTLLITNASGLTASSDFIYDAEPAWTATGALGTFVDGSFTTSGTVIRVQAAEGGDTITYAKTDSAGATDSNAVAGLVFQTTGYLTGTLAGTDATTYNFYATAKDEENQVTIPTLFNIISRDYAGVGGVLDNYSGFRVHVFQHASPMPTNASTAINFYVYTPITASILILAGGGGGSAGPTQAGNGGSGAGAGGMLALASQSLAAGTYIITIGGGGEGGVYSGAGAANAVNAPWGRQGVNSSVICSAVSYSKTAYGGGHGSNENVGTLMVTQHGGSGGGDNAAGSNFGRGTYASSTAGAPYNVDPRQGYDGGAYSGSGGIAGGGGGASQLGQNENGGNGATNDYRTGSNITYAGGGGGAGNITGTQGTGGTGGGGAGNGSGNGAQGTNHFGGGGGGGQDNTPGHGGNGGSGIVIVRYAI